MKDKEQLILHPKFQNNIPYQKPEAPEDLASKTLTEITNAINAHAYLDMEGKLWISSASLHIVLRTNKPISNYILDTISIGRKKNIDGTTFVRGFEVMGQITKAIEEAGLSKKGKYLRFSEGCLSSIRDSDKAKALRGEYEEYWKEEKKKLKSKRIKQFGINNDELTGEKLVIKTAEFSHIRSVSVFKHFALDVENGLIINKETHDIITQCGINDENELLFLCEENEWDIGWYEKYNIYLKSKEK